MFSSYIGTQKKRWGNEDIIRNIHCLTSPEEELGIEIIDKWFIEKGSKVRRSGLGKVPSKDVIAVEVGLSLIPPRTWSKNGMTMLCYFGAVRRWRRARRWGWVKLKTSLSHVACFDEGQFFGEGGSSGLLMARTQSNWG